MARKGGAPPPYLSKGEVTCRMPITVIGRLSSCPDSSGAAQAVAVTRNHDALPVPVFTGAYRLGVSKVLVLGGCSSASSGVVDL